MNKRILTVLVSVLLMQITAIGLVIFTAGAGHGSYAVARILFPFTMLSTVFGNHIGSLYIAIGLLQYLVYGFIIAAAMRTNKTNSAIAAIIVAHIITMLVVFIWQNESFPN